MTVDIIVLARPFDVFSQTDTFYMQQGGSPAGPGVVYGEMVASEMAAKDNVKVDPDAQSPEIVVVANRLKEDLLSVAFSAAVNSNGGWESGFILPCIGEVKYAEIAGNAKNMTFRLTTRNYGPGRAGENLAGSDGNNVPVNMNGAQAIGYGKLNNGTMYLVTHEIAHSLLKMQQYANQMWQQYVARTPNMTHAQRVADYPTTPEFAANEARSNTVARAIAQDLGLGVISPDPKHGYQVC